MKVFTQTPTCTSGLHCQSCRDRKGGLELRIRWGQHFIMPAGGEAFTCPLGKPWGWQAPSRGLGDTIAKVTRALGIKECGGCKKRKEALNRLVPYSHEPRTPARTDEGTHPASGPRSEGSSTAPASPSAAPAGRPTPPI
jgi:hypothetical protein